MKRNETQQSQSQERLLTEKVPPVDNGKDRNPHRLGWITIFVIFGLLGAWAIFAKIDMTVKTGGKVISKGFNKVIEHPRGGVITRIYAHEGDVLKTGDPILKLDDIDIDSKLQRSIRSYDEMLLQIARLKAETKFAKHPNFKAVETALIKPKNVESFQKEQERLFESNIQKILLKKELLNNRNNILKVQNEGLQARIASNRRQLESLEKELSKWQKLYERNMTDQLKLLDLQRKIESIKSTIAQDQSKIKENQATMESNQKQIELEESAFVNDAQKKLQELTIKLGNIKEQIRALRNQKKRMIITAPSGGHLVNMKVHSAGEVVTPHKPIAFIVPQSKQLVMELYIKPTDIDKVHVGQKADIKFPSYVDPSARPIEGLITYVSADTVPSPDGKHSYYKALAEITPAGMKAIQENKFEIVPGMPVSAFIKAGKRSFLSYILLPLQQLAKGAFHAN